MLRVTGTGCFRKRKKDCDVHLTGECRETSKCVIKMVKCGEHRLLLVLSCLVCNYCWLAVCIVVVVLCVLLLVLSCLVCNYCWLNVSIVVVVLCVLLLV